MWSVWQPKSRAAVKNIVLISFEKDELTGPGLETYFARISGLRKMAIRKKDKIFGWFYYRIGYCYLNRSI
ncbi:MAG: hypothetical protein K9K82_07315 [Desulfobacteraceae bacterium]|nr:hypothetical protein [Desulfobacteraceae bacterium]